MKYFIKSFIVPLTIASIFMSGCGKTEEEVQEEDYTAVQVTEASSSSIKKEYTYSGQVKPNETINVVSKLSGIADEVYFEEGDVVKKGDVLFTLDKKDIEDQIKQLEASLKINDASIASAQTGLKQASNGGQIQSSRLQLEQGVDNAKTAVDNAKIAVESAKSNVDNAEVSLDSSKTSVENAKISLDNAKASLDDITKTYKNMKTLYDAGVVSKSDFDSTELGYTQAKNGYEQAQNAYTQAQNTYTQAQNSYSQVQNAYNQSKLALEQAENSYSKAVDSLNIFDEQTVSDNTDTAQAGVNSALAGKNSVETQLQIARETLDDTTIKAPISGIITQKNIHSTSAVSASSNPYTIVDMSTVTVDLNVPENIINSIKTGQSVDITIGSVSDSKIKGIIKTITPIADSTNTYPIKVEIDNSDNLIKPGMFAEVHFAYQQSNNTIVVPVNTIIEEGTKKFVYVVVDNKAVKTEVETGIDNGESIELTGGVKKGDKIVTTGQNYIKDESPVKIVTDIEDNQEQSE